MDVILDNIMYEYCIDGECGSSGQARWAGWPFFTKLTDVQQGLVLIQMI